MKERREASCHTLVGNGRHSRFEQFDVLLDGGQTSKRAVVSPAPSYKRPCGSAEFRRHSDNWVVVLFADAYRQKLGEIKEVHRTDVPAIPQIVMQNDQVVCRIVFDVFEGFFILLTDLPQPLDEILPQIAELLLAEHQEMGAGSNVNFHFVYSLNARVRRAGFYCVPVALGRQIKVT